MGFIENRSFLKAFEYQGLMLNLVMLGQMFGDYRILLGHEKKVQSKASAREFMYYAKNDLTIDLKEHMH